LISIVASLVTSGVLIGIAWGTFGQKVSTLEKSMDEKATKEALGHVKDALDEKASREVLDGVRSAVSDLERRFDKRFDRLEALLRRRGDADQGD
jgi:hypothetical protein